jgi:hypothetical protein
MPYPNSKNNKVFGQSMSKKKGGGKSNYQRQFGGSSKNAYNGSNSNSNSKDDTSSEEAQRAARRRLRQEQGEAIDAKFGYNRLEDGQQDGEVIEKRGWIFHMLPTTVSILRNVYCMLYT